MSLPFRNIILNCLPKEMILLKLPFFTLMAFNIMTLQIPVGSRFVGIPGRETAENPSGIMVEVYWEQDDSGTLCISGHSDEMPVPPNVQPLASLRSLSLRSASQRRRFGQGGPVHGIVYDPEQVAAYNSR